MYKIKNHPTLSYNLVNNVAGWGAFFVALITYISTVEPTAALWDCGEFIMTSVGLQLGHPPGNPLFMIIARFFAIFAPSPEKQALMINIMSAAASAFTILFLFWTITHLARKLVIGNNKECSMAQLMAIMAAGMIGALTFTFTDTFWFSAVEGEVYALSSLLTAVMFWAILKWEDIADEPYANRWLVFFAFLTGLSIGIHFLNLLVIPPVVFVYYFKKYKPTVKGVISALFISAALVGLILWVVIPGVIIFSGWFELFFVNKLGMHFNTGVIIYAILLVGLLAFGTWYTLKNNHTVMNTVMTCIVVLLIGFSCYAIVVIRSIANPPVDENSPDNIFSLLYYVNREQYGSEPLLYGPYYNAPIIDMSDGVVNWYQNHTTGKYEPYNPRPEYKYDERFCTFLPRMYSPQQHHIMGYQIWGGEANGATYMVNGEARKSPSFGNNLKFLFNYQLNHMYFRYFMWNFSGRQNDIQGDGDFRYGNWITGIPFIDKVLIGDQEELPDHLKNEKARNRYYMLPFILGLIGIFYQYQKSREGKQDFWVVMLLFFITGLAIVLYLNQTPYQPRERDYAYAGSFYAFAIWIGLGVLSLWEVLSKYMKPGLAIGVVFGVCLLAVPVNMLAENYDDHDRSGRYATVAHAKNYLNTCAENAIIFTYGDNDTFPLWYAQEVEGVRRDIRVVNLSLLAGYWYIDMISRKAYESPGVKVSFTKDQYRPGVRDIIPVEEINIGRRDLKEVMRLVGMDDKRAQVRYGDQMINFIPTRDVYISVDKEKVLANGTVQPEDADLIVDQLDIRLDRNNYTKSDLMVLDIIASNDWDRPIYFGIGMGTENFLGLEKYLQLEGAAYRLVPIMEERDERDGTGRINTKILYENLMEKFDWGNIKDPKVYMDYFHKNTVAIMKYRHTFQRLAMKFVEESGIIQDEETTQDSIDLLTIDKESCIDSSKLKIATKILDKSLEELPFSQIPPDMLRSDICLLDYIQIYYMAGEFEKGNVIAREIMTYIAQDIRYFNSLPPHKRQMTRREEEHDEAIIRSLASYAYIYGQEEFIDELQEIMATNMTPRAALKKASKSIPEKREELIKQESREDSVSDSNNITN